MSILSLTRITYFVVCYFLQPHIRFRAGKPQNQHTGECGCCCYSPPLHPYAPFFWQSVQALGKHYNNEVVAKVPRQKSSSVCCLHPLPSLFAGFAKLCTRMLHLSSAKRQRLHSPTRRSFLLPSNSLLWWCARIRTNH